MTLEEIFGNAKALVEDRTYKIGEISEKTGLQKTANGWVKPKSNKGAKKDASGADVLNNKYYKDDVLTAEGEAKIVSQMDTKVIQKRIDELETLKKQNGGKLGTHGERELKIKKAELEKRNKENGPKENGVEKKTNKKPSIQEYMKAKDLMKKHEAQYKKEMDDYEYMERLKANGVNTSIFNPMFGGKPQPLENRSSYKEAMETVKSYETEDSACRITADTKIKLKNVVENKVKENA